MKIFLYIVTELNLQRKPPNQSIYSEVLNPILNGWALVVVLQTPD